MADEAQIVIPAAGHHPPMWGRFARGELVYALAVGGRTWQREPREDAATFEQRIVRDLFERANTGSHAFASY
ncbi:hypothetical protein LG047_08905 [Methylocystis sp. WRRC1]|uniref:hypothetical protein n=1 Tax=Methylocystis sp. WRRC1 TaxID=1732014 RepID=UPI001D13E842|nr:hypothetical protein [Methylocystis sp. WRRC1]MCC3245438.1 hypothetical protein [Methylocystis sp. WRRC1]